MKKVGMTPMMNKSLNNFVVKKENTSSGASAIGSPSLMVNRDGTGGAA